MNREDIKYLLRSIRKNFKDFIITGSYIRGDLILHDLDIMMYEEDYNNFIYSLNKIKYKIIRKSKKRAQVLIEKYKIDIFFYNDENFLFMKFMLDSPKSYNVRIRRVAKLKGYKLSQNGLYKITQTGLYRKISVNNERELCKIIGVTFRRPINRF